MVDEYYHYKIMHVKWKNLYHVRIMLESSWLQRWQQWLKMQNLNRIHYPLIGTANELKGHIWVYTQKRAWEVLSAQGRGCTHLSNQKNREVFIIRGPMWLLPYLGALIYKK